MRPTLTQRAFTVVATTAALWLLWPAAVAQAQQPTAETALQGQSLRGQSLYRYWGFEVYMASLFTAADFDAPRFGQQRFALELQYRRAFEGADIAQRSIDEMQAIEPLTAQQAQDWLAAMRRAFPDVRPGDRLLGLHLPGSGAHFYLNGRLHARVDDPVFAERFFGIWLSPRTSAPQLRAALIADAAR